LYGELFVQQADWKRWLIYLAKNYGDKTAMQAPYQIFKRLSDNRFVWVENIEELQEARGRLAHLAASSEAHYVLFDPRAKSVVAHQM
jgi:hypothetical protein